jgi:hypothetical protein
MLVANMSGTQRLNLHILQLTFQLCWKRVYDSWLRDSEAGPVGCAKGVEKLRFGLII